MRTTRTRCLAALITTTSLLGVSACGSKGSTAQPITVPSTVSASPTGASPITPSSASMTPSTSGTASSGPDVDQQAKNVVSRLVSVRDQIAQNPKIPLEQLLTVTHDPIYQSYAAEYMEWRNSGWEQKGGEKIVSMDASGKEPTVKVKACIDVSSTDLVDAKSKSVVPKNRKPRTSALFTVQHLTDGWYVTDEKSSGSAC